MANPNDKRPVVFKPSTFARHEAAFGAVASSIVTRHPKNRKRRFPGVMPGAWGLLAEGDTISAVSGITLGSGEVKLCDKEGTILDDAEITVLNAGHAMTGDPGGKVVALQWTDGSWSVCGCRPSAGDCYPQCAACGTARYNWGAGTATDDNGTWQLRWDPGQTSGFYFGEVVTSPVRTGYDEFSQPICGEALIQYVVVFECGREGAEEGTISAQMSVGTVTFSCGDEPSFATSVFGDSGFSTSEWSDVEPTGCNPLAATFPFVWGDSPGGLTIPVTSVEISVPVDELSTGSSSFACAGPCPIPREELVLSWGNSIDGPGSLTLAYNADGGGAGVPTWSTSEGPWGSTSGNGRATLSIDPGTKRTLFEMDDGISSWICGPSEIGEIGDALWKVDWECSPYHLHLSCVAGELFGGSCQDLIDLGYEHFYIDKD